MDGKPETAAMDISLEEIAVQLVSVPDNGVYPLRALALFYAESGQHDAVDASETVFVDRVDLFESRETCFEVRELPDPDRRLKVRELEIESDTVMNVVSSGASHRTALILQLAQSHFETRIEKDKHPAWPNVPR